MNSTSSYSSGQPLDNMPQNSSPKSAPLQTQAQAEQLTYSAESQVRVGVATQSALPTGVPPVSTACQLHGAEPANGFTRVIMTAKAIAQVKAHAESDTLVELGGLLLGHVYTHNQQIFVEVHEAIPAETLDKGSVHFTFTADTWRQLNKAGEAFPDLVPVGWFHTHPDLGVFFSSDDEVVHATFPHPWMVGLVVDPVRQQVNYFGWLDGQIRPIGGFYEKFDTAASSPNAPQASMPWRVTIDESLFFSSYRNSTGVAPFDAGLPPVSPWMGVILGGTSLAISLVTLGLVVYKFWIQ